MDPNISIFDAFSYENEHILIQRKKGIQYIGNMDNKVFGNVEAILLYPVNQEKMVHEILKNSHLTLDSTLIIAAHIKSVVIETMEYVTALVSAHNRDHEEINELIINIIVFINKDLNNNILMKSYSKALEAKIAALWDLDIRSPSWDLFTGSNEDELITACRGTANRDIDQNELQNLVENCVRKAVKGAIIENGFSRGVVDFMEGVGVKIDDLVEAGMELLVGVEDNEDLRHKLRQQLLKSLEDLNVVSFIIAGIRLEEDYAKHRIEGIDVTDDPASLYSDEVFGMSIANQIAGTKAIFNFKRYDEEKPGIIGRLGPVLDDVFAGLVAGCMSKIFE